MKKEILSKILMYISYVPLLVAVIPVALVVFYFDTPFEVINTVWKQCNMFFTENVLNLFIVVATCLIIFAFLRIIADFLNDDVLKEKYEAERRQLSKETSNLKVEADKDKNKVLSDNKKKVLSERLSSCDEKANNTLTLLCKHYDDAQNKLIEQYEKSLRYTGDIAQICHSLGDENYKHFEYQKKEVESLLKQYDDIKNNHADRTR